MPEFRKIESEDQTRISGDLTREIARRIEQATAFGEVRDAVQTYGQSQLERARKEVVKLAQPDARITYATAADMRVSFAKGELSTEDDVFEYAEALKQSWIKLVQSGKRIGVT